MDEGAVKIVIGSVMKVVKTGELASPHNLAFFDRMFSEAEVLVVESVSAIGKDGFADMLRAYGATAKAMHAGGPKAKLPASRAVPTQEESMAEPGIPAADEGIFYKSHALTHITIDDLPTGREIDEGFPECVSVAPGGAINLSLIEESVVKKSRILQRLIANGTLEPISAQEASRIQAAEERRRAAMDRAPGSEILTTSVSSYIDGAQSAKATDGQDREFVPMEEESPSQEFNTESYNFNSLNDFLNERERVQDVRDEPSDRVQPQPSRIQARTRVAATGIAAKGIARKE